MKRANGNTVPVSARNHSNSTESVVLLHGINKLKHGDWDLDSGRLVRSICDKKLREKLDADSNERQDMGGKLMKLEDVMKSH